MPDFHYLRWIGANCRYFPTVWTIDLAMNATRPVLLVVDDDPGFNRLIQQFGRRQGFDVISHGGGSSVVAALPALRADVAMIDLQMPDVGGLDVLRAIRDADPACQVILMTAHASVDTAIQAVKLGALDYLSKPLDFARAAELLETVRHGIERRRKMLAADSRLASEFEFCGMIGRSPVMQELFDSIRRLAPHARVALVRGETGTGKELVARALHKMSSRRDKRFVVCNCSAVVESLSESEFFGHVRGAFSGALSNKPGLFERADKGTLFLDEIGELPLALQAKLLRVVESGEIQRVGDTDTRMVDVRIVAATNRDLVDEVRAGRFRQDLLFRLNVVEFVVPPLRDRRGDVAYLSASFMHEFAGRFEKPLVGITPGAERILLDAAWPGNVRELRNTIERACMLSEGRMLTERELLETRGTPFSAPARAPSSEAPPPHLDFEQIQQALRGAGGNKAAAARALGISRRALYRRLEQSGPE